MKDFIIYSVVIFFTLTFYKMLTDKIETHREDKDKKKALVALEHRDKKIKKLEQELKERDAESKLLNQVFDETKKLRDKEIAELKKESNSTIGKLNQKISTLQLEIMALDAHANSVPDVVDGPQPDKPSRYVIFHSCERKLAFKTIGEAEAAKETFDARYNKKHKIYECRYCGKYHLATVRESSNGRN
jgi:seryl-tRNA synthetase